MGLNTRFTEISTLIARDLQSGTGTSRQSLGGGGSAFGWAGGLPRTLADFVTTRQSSGMTVNLTTVVPNAATPAQVVAPGAPKPNAITIASAPEPLVKHAGYGEAQLEQYLDAEGLAAAIASVLQAGCLLSFEAAAMGVLDADAGATASGATWLAAIHGGQATVIGNGGSPGVLVVSSADYGAILGEITSGAGFAISPTGSAVGSYMGSAVHVSPKLPTGKAYVLDPSAVLAVEHENSPLVIVDSVSQAKTNITTIVADLLATTVVVNPVLVAEVTKTAVQAAATTTPKQPAGKK